jgi:hypothetical protein
VAGHYGREARGGRIEIELRKVVKNVNRMAANLDNVVCRKAARLRTLVVIATDRADGREGSECIQDCRVADVATMNDEVRIMERIERFGPNQSMGI